MVDGGPFFFSEANRHHLQQAALELMLEIRMRFDSIDENDVVGFGSDPIDKDGHAILSFTDLHGVKG